MINSTLCARNGCLRHLSMWSCTKCLSSTRLSSPTCLYCWTTRARSYPSALVTSLLRATNREASCPKQSSMESPSSAGAHPIAKTLRRSLKLQECSWGTRFCLLRIWYSSLTWTRWPSLEPSLQSKSLSSSIRCTSETNLTTQKATKKKRDSAWPSGAKCSSKRCLKACSLQSKRCPTT